MASLPRLPLWLKRNHRQFMKLYQGKTAIFPTPDTAVDKALLATTATSVYSLDSTKPSSPLHVSTSSTITTTTTETATVNIDGVQSNDDNSIVIKTTLEANATVINETVSSTTANSNTNDKALTIRTETSSATSTIVVINQHTSNDTTANREKNTASTNNAADKMDIDTSNNELNSITNASAADANAPKIDNNGSKRDNSDSTNTNSNTNSDAIDNNDDNNNSSDNSMDDGNGDKKLTVAVTTGAIGSVGIKSRPLQRTNCTGCNRDYFVDDRSEMNVCFKKYRVVFVMNKNAVLYKVNSIPKARKMHPIVTRKMSQKFQKFVNKWHDENISAEQDKRCMDWFMGNIPDSIPNIETVKVQVNDETKTPYRPYNRYKVKRCGNS